MPSHSNRATNIFSLHVCFGIIGARTETDEPDSEDVRLGLLCITMYCKFDNELAKGDVALQAVKNLTVEPRVIMEKTWTAFLRLKGKTRAKNTAEIIEQFDALVQSLQGVDIDYNIVVLFDKDSRVHGSLNSVQHPPTKVPSGRSQA
jgi:hypothetical protein